MASEILSVQSLDVPCPGRACTEMVDEVRKRLDGGRVVTTYGCPTGSEDHVPYGWKPS